MDSKCGQSEAVVAATEMIKLMVVPDMGLVWGMEERLRLWRARGLLLLR